MTRVKHLVESAGLAHHYGNETLFPRFRSLLDLACKTPSLTLYGHRAEVNVVQESLRYAYM